MQHAVQIGLVLFLGIAASIQDIRRKRVSNYLILSVAAVFLALLFSGIFNPAPWDNKAILANGLIALVAGSFMWWGKIWPAGDAKLFAAFALILPFRYYENRFLPYFPSFAILINTFFIALSILVLFVLRDAARYVFSLVTGKIAFAQTVEKIRVRLVKGAPIMIRSVLLLLSVFLPARILGDYVSGAGGAFFSRFVMINFLLMFVLYRQIYVFLKARVSLNICLVILAAGLTAKFFILGMNLPALALYVLGLLKVAIVFMLGIQALMVSFELYIKLTQVVSLPVRDVKPGTVIEKECWEDLLEKHDSFQCEERLRPDGLDAGQADFVRSVLGHDQDIEVSKTWPFAPIIFAGVIFTMVLRQSVLHIILTMVS